MNKPFFFLFFLFLGLFTTATVHAASVYPAAAYRGSEITVYYDSYDCGGSYSGSVSIDGYYAEVTEWYPCLGTVSVIVPENSYDGIITINTKSGQVETLSGLDLLPNPRINGFSPMNVTPGETVITVTGNNFGDTFYNDALYLEYSDGAAVEITRASWSDGEISFVAPDNISAAKITLRKWDSSAGFSSFISSDYFYIQPTITSLDYSQGEAGDLITIYGENFSSLAEFSIPFASDTQFRYNIEVTFNGVPAKIGTWEWNHVQAYVPEGATSGPVAIKIYSNDLGAQVNANGPYFEILSKSTSDQYSAYQTYLKEIGIEDAWTHTRGSRDVVVAVIDDGVYINHPDLKDNIWKNTGEIIGNGIDDDKNGFVDDIFGWDFVSNVGEMTTRGSHGTMVAGIIGARGGNQEGISGINWYVTLMPLIVCDSIGCSLEKVAEAIKYAADNGADIINLSLGTFGTTGYKTILNDSIEYAKGKDVLIVAASGNGDLEGGIGIDLGRIPQSPVCNTNESGDLVLGVGASNGQYRTDWTNYGACVDVYAPGVGIVSTSVPAYSTINGFYDIESGSSLSAPIVSGVAALLKAKYPSMGSNEITSRIIRNSSNGIVNAARVFSEPYTPEDQNVVYAKDEGSNETPVDGSLLDRVKGYILLQVESVGEAWYVHPEKLLRYYMKNGDVAYSMMRSFGLGVSDTDLSKIPAVSDTSAMKSSSSVCSTNSIASRLKGRILLQVQQHGEAWYIDPDKCRRIYMRDGEAAYQIMRFLGLGITNTNLFGISVGEL